MLRITFHLPTWRGDRGGRGGEGKSCTQSVFISRTTASGFQLAKICLFAGAFHRWLRTEGLEDGSLTQLLIWGCPNSLSPFVTPPPRYPFGPQTFTLIGQFMFSPTACQWGCQLLLFSLPPLPVPLRCWRLCFRESLKRFFCSLSRQQSLLTSLLSYLGTCCQLLSAHNQLRWITLQWDANLHIAKLVPHASHS